MVHTVQKTLGIRRLLVLAAAVIVVGVLVWQGVTANGNPDPTNKHLSHGAAIVDTGILVFREGLETILVLSAITASLIRTRQVYWRPISSGAGLAFAATIVTWFVVVGIISLVGQTTPELDIQAGTGLLAIIVLLIVMNWFFHRIYWTGWISMHNRKKKEIITTLESSSEAGSDASALETAKSVAYKGLLVLGFTSVYREGFEVDLFLQSTRMQLGSGVVVIGAAIGLFLSLIVAVLTFLAHRKLPYKKCWFSRVSCWASFCSSWWANKSKRCNWLVGWAPPPFQYTFPIGWGSGSAYSIMSRALSRRLSPHCLSSVPTLAHSTLAFGNLVDNMPKTPRRKSRIRKKRRRPIAPPLFVSPCTTKLSECPRFPRQLTSDTPYPCHSAA
ncbi:FTR1 family iron permease [Alicyclobacillus suci]|uniref:FTR1 family iron permease n=1 Tax=Alicyclobacillus suci TaxID=2816080 RepID=UPI001F228166|nr:FTR1 family protein [Alicyclobacillus suci]